jgi:hypothetical protein
MYVYDGQTLIRLRFHQQNLSKHDVTADEVVECFADPGGWKERANRGAYARLGKTLNGRLLEVAYL